MRVESVCNHLGPNESLRAQTEFSLAKPRIEAVRIVDMSGSNSWAEFAGLFRSTRQAFLDHERSKVELKALMPEDAKARGPRQALEIRRSQL